MARRTFLLGIGCQKGGTTWLYDYLQSLPDVALSRPKELHVFDAMLRPDLFYWQYLLAVQEARFDKAAWFRKLTPRRAGRVAPAERLRMMSDPAAYVDYFLRLQAPVLVGEISPSYAVLSSENFAFIRSVLEPHFDLKVVFLMRDPIERVYSAIRFFDERPPAPKVRGFGPARFAELYDSPALEGRTRYERTIISLERVFAKDEIFYGFSETLFSDEAVRSLCGFLGIGYRPPEFSKKVNASPVGKALDPVAVVSARAHYEATYRFCAERFGEAFIAGIWKHYAV